MTEHPDSNLIDIFASILDDFQFKPTIHVYYESKTVSVKDGLPKFKDLPAEFNGSGATIQEWKHLDKFKELKTLIYEYRDKKELEINSLNKDHLKLKNEIEINQKSYEKLIDEAADEISSFVEKANLENISK